MVAISFIYVFRAPLTMKRRGGCDCTCRCNSLPAPSRARRAAAIERLMQIPADRLQRDLPGCDATSGNAAISA